MSKEPNIIKINGKINKTIKKALTAKTKELERSESYIIRQALKLYLNIKEGN